MKCIYATSKAEARESCLDPGEFGGWGTHRVTLVLETSDIKIHGTDKYAKYYVDFDGSTKPATMPLTLTMTDWQLLRDQYDLKDLRILDGCYFKARYDLFDSYIDKYRQIKMTSKGARRELAKLFLNNLYGKMAASKDSSVLAYL